MKKAFTLIELLVVIAIIAIATAITIPFVGGNSQEASPEQSMRDYLTTLYPSYEIIGVACTGGNSSGYVDCSATLKDPDGKVIEKNAECASNPGGGCRAISVFK